MTLCKTKHCPYRVLPRPGAVFCAGCQERALERIGTIHPYPEPAIPYPPGAPDWWTGIPNVTCPACGGRYHYGAPVPFTHLCPLCRVWLCWKETDKMREKKTRVGRACPVCGKTLQEKPGKYGPWWGCTWVKKNHKDNCPGKRQWSDCNIEAAMVPRLGLAVWKAYVWDDGNAVDRFAKLDRETQERKTAIEARQGRYKKPWWERKGLGLDE